MDIAVTPTTSLEVKDQWMNFSLNHALAVENGKFVDTFNCSAYVQSLFFQGDKDGNPSGYAIQPGLNANMRSMSVEDLEKLLAGEMADGRTVKEYLTAGLAALAKGL